MRGRHKVQVTLVEELWTTCSDVLKAEVSEAVWRTWFAEVRPEGMGEGSLTLSAPSSLVRDRLLERYAPLIGQAAQQASGAPVEVQIVVRPTPPGVDLPVDINASPTWPQQVPTVAHEVREIHTTRPTGRDADRQDLREGGGGSRVDVPSLNPRYTFEAFVIGASNRFAHAAAQRVAETPAESYNPLFIYGDSGLGKTHLLHAMGHYVVQNFPGKRVRYVSTETFMNDFVDAIRTNGQTMFKRRYRECDVLLVDDIQFMEGKEGLQEEFFHTFNWLYEGSKQIVLSSDRHPRSIATLEDRLRSRFEWGLTTDVQPPELETRLAILRKKADGERIPIPGDVLELIATHVRDNIRELEGALIRVSAFSSLNREPPTVEVAARVLSDIIDADRPRQITPKLILDQTATAFGFSVEDICGTSRRRPLVNARQIGMYVFRELTDYSYPAIAREFGGRDHTTVIHAVEKVTGLMKERRQVYDQVTDLIFNIKGGS